MAGKSHRAGGWHFVVAREDLVRMPLEGLLDMLRYDRATVYTMLEDVIVLQTASTAITPDRWASFGAPVLAVGRVNENKPYSLAREAQRALAASIVNGPIAGRRHNR